MTPEIKAEIREAILSACQEAKSMDEICRLLPNCVKLYSESRIRNMVQAMGSLGILTTRGHGDKRTLYIAPKEVIDE